MLTLRHPGDKKFLFLAYRSNPAGIYPILLQECLERDDSRLESKSGKVLGETYMLKRTDSAAMTKANVTMAYTRQEFISLSYNCPRIGSTDLYGGSVVSETHTPFSMFFVHLMAFQTIP